MTFDQANDLLRRAALDELSAAEIESLRDELIRKPETLRQLLANDELRTQLAKNLESIGHDLDSIELSVQEIQTNRVRSKLRPVVAVASLILVAACLFGIDWNNPEGDFDNIREAGSTGSKVSDQAANEHEHVSEKSIDEATVSTELAATTALEQLNPISDADTKATANTTIASQPVATLQGPWDAALRAQPVSFEVAAAQPFEYQDAPTIQELKDWFGPTEDNDQQFFSATYDNKQLNGISGVFRFLAPVQEGATLRFSIPDHQDLRIFMYRGEAGVMIQQNDTDNRAHTRMRSLEQDLTTKKQLLSDKLQELKSKNDAARSPLKAIQDAINTAKKLKDVVTRAERELPKAIAAAEKANAEYRKADQDKKNTTRAAAKAVSASRAAAQKVRTADAALRRNRDDERLIKAVESAKANAKKAVDLDRAAAKAKSHATRIWSQANSRKRSADRLAVRSRDSIKLAEQRHKLGEKRVALQEARAKRFIDARDLAQQAVNQTQAAIDETTKAIAAERKNAATEANRVHAEPNGWAAWSTQRTPAAVFPKTRILNATDCGRNYSTDLRHINQFELRYVDEQIMLTRGDVLLLSVPMSGSPTEVFFSGRLLFDGIDLVKTTDEPGPTRADFSTERQTTLIPANIDWGLDHSTTLNFNALADGSVELVSSGRTLDVAIDNGVDEVTKEDVWISLEEQTAEFVVLDVIASPGAEIVLGSEEDDQLARLVYFRDPKTESLAVRWRSTDDLDSKTIDRQSKAFPRCVPELHSIRLLRGCGNVKAWISDGADHWSAIRPPAIPFSGEVTRIGLTCRTQEADSSILVQHIHTERFQHLKSVADSVAIPENRQLPKLSFSNWPQVLEQRPRDVSAEDWSRVNAVRFLCSGCDSDLAEQLIDLLVNDEIVVAKTPQDQFALLHELALLTNLWDDASRTNRMVDRFHLIALRALNSPEKQALDANAQQLKLRPFSTLSRTLMSLPLWTRHRVSVENPTLIRHELLHLVYRNKWHEVAQFCQRLQSLQLVKPPEPAPVKGEKRTAPDRSSYTPTQLIVDWSRGLAAEHLQSSATANQARMPAEWRHPLIHRVNKELYNQLAEFSAAIWSNALDDALKIEASFDPTTMQGVAPSTSIPLHDASEIGANDPGKLFVSFKTAVESARADSPEFSDYMDEVLIPKALIRLRQAMVVGDEASVSLAAIRYADTPVAKAANEWLGDRAMSTGHFRNALKHFRMARDPNQLATNSEVDSKLGLAAAMLGCEQVEWFSRPVRLNDTTVPAVEFMTLLAEMRESRATSFAQFVQSQPDRDLRSLDPGFALRIHESIEELKVVRTAPAVTQMRTSGFARRLAMATDESRLFVNSGFQVTAYDLNNGKRIWSTKPTGGVSVAVTMVGMKPVIAGDFVFVRQWDAYGPSLVCYSRISGKRVWHRPSSENEVTVCDPMLYRENVYVLQANRSKLGNVVLRLVVVEPLSGKQLDVHDLVNLEASWWDRKLCRVSADNGSFIATTGGIVFSSKLAGELLWLRAQTMLPSEVDTHWAAQSLDPPLIDARNVYVTQPGVPLIECIDRLGGQLRWRTILPSLCQLVGLNPDRVIVTTQNQILGLDRKTGDTVWSHDCEASTTWTRYEPDGRIIYFVGPPKHANPELVWLDARTGQRTATMQLDSLPEQQPHLGPVLVNGKKAWSFCGRNPNDARPILVELLQTPAKNND